eukprot:g1800.t1
MAPRRAAARDFQILFVGSGSAHLRLTEAGFREAQVDAERSEALLRFARQCHPMYGGVELPPRAELEAQLLSARREALRGTVASDTALARMTENSMAGPDGGHSVLLDAGTSGAADAAALAAAAAQLRPGLVTPYMRVTRAVKRLCSGQTIGGVTYAKSVEVVNAQSRRFKTERTGTCSGVSAGAHAVAGARFILTCCASEADMEREPALADVVCEVTEPAQVVEGGWRAIGAEDLERAWPTPGGYDSAVAAYEDGERGWGLGGNQAAVHFAFKPTGEEAPALPPPGPQAHTGSLLNEYTSNHLILGGAAPFDFVHGVPEAFGKGQLPLKVRRRLLSSGCGRFERNTDLVFLLFSQFMRHNTNSQLSYQAKAGKLRELEQLMQQEDFDEQLRAAVTEPGSDTAKRMVETLLPLMRRVEARVPYSAEQRRAEIGELLAMEVDAIKELLALVETLERAGGDAAAAESRSHEDELNAEAAEAEASDMRKHAALSRRAAVATAETQRRATAEAAITQRATAISDALHSLAAEVASEDGLPSQENAAAEVGAAAEAEARRELADEDAKAARIRAEHTAAAVRAAAATSAGERAEELMERAAVRRREAVARAAKALRAAAGALRSKLGRNEGLLSRLLSQVLAVLQQARTETAVEGPLAAALKSSLQWGAELRGEEETDAEAARALVGDCAAGRRNRSVAKAMEHLRMAEEEEEGAIRIRFDEAIASARERATQAAEERCMAEEEALATLVRGESVAEVRVEAAVHAARQRAEEAGRAYEEAVASGVDKATRRRREAVAARAAELDGAVAAARDAVGALGAAAKAALDRIVYEAQVETEAEAEAEAVL